MTYACIQAQRLGLSVGVVTRAGPDIALDDALPGASVAGRPSKQTTTFENLYSPKQRRQRVLSRAEPLTAEDVPPAWRRAPLALLAPVYGEVPPDMATTFPDSMVGVCAQGWLRSVDREHRVRRRAWAGPPFWQGCQALFASDEDLGRRRDQLDRWMADVPIVALTSHETGAELHHNSAWRRIEAYPAQQTDATGAGDIFAATFLVRYHETADLDKSARFASAAASCSVEGNGTESIASRSQIEARMNDYPEIALR